MSIKLVSHEDNKAIFNADVKREDFNKAVKDVYLKNRKDFNIPGFRKGKAPRQIIEANYGKEIFYGEALDKLMQEAYVEAIGELKLEPINTPQADVDGLEGDGDLVLKFEVETKPVYEIKDYSKIEVVKDEDQLDESLVDARIEDEREKNKIIQNISDRPVEAGDTVEIDFEGFKDGVSFEGGKAEDYELKIGSNSFIPGFEDQIIGKQHGEEFDINVTFPEDYHVEDLKGQPVVFKVKVNAIRQEVLPEVDDEFVMDISEFDTLEEYKNDVRAKLQEELDKQNKLKLENSVIEKLIEINDIKAPKVMVEDKIDEEVHNYGHNLEQMGFTLESFMSATHATEEDIRNQFRDQAEKQIQAQLLLDSILLKEDIEVSDQEIEDEYKSIAKEYGQVDNEEFIDSVKAAISKDYMKDMVAKRKLVDKLVANAVFVEAKEEEEDQEKED
ncbi:MAG: trigger factor [Tissierellia bacterium]|nr:trigger factor [Tissierellia bacterium]